jgi:hypothetical protein
VATAGLLAGRWLVVDWLSTVGAGVCVLCRVVKLVRALRKGWIKRGQVEPEKPTAYLIWEDDGEAHPQRHSGPPG